MSHNLEQALEGTHEEALAAVEEIQKSLKRYGTMKNVENIPQLKMTYAYNVLRIINKAESKTQFKHRDICCNIMENILAPHISPLIDAKIWSYILQALCYYHYNLLNGKHFLETERILQFLITTRKNILRNQDDYKIVLSLYSQHLLLQRSRSNDEGKLQVNCILQALTELFNDMQKAHVELNFQYPELIKHLHSDLMRTTGVLAYLSTMPNVNKMFENFFALLAALKMPQQVDADQVQALAEQHIELLHALMQFDIKDKLQKKITLLYLEVCCKLPLWQEHKALGKMFKLIHYYVQCVYSKSIKNLPKLYNDICEKFQIFFEQCDQNFLLKNKGLLELLAVLYTFLVNMKPSVDNSSSIFETFWQQMTETEAYIAHVKFLMTYNKLATNIKDSKFNTWKCCTSMRKHIIINIVISAMGQYTIYFLKYVKQTDAEPMIQSVRELQNLISGLVVYGIKVLETHSCTDVQTSNIYSYRFMQVASDLCIAPHSYGAFKFLMQDMPKLQLKLGQEEWLFILRRISRIQFQAHNARLLSEINSLYIVNLLQNSNDTNLLRNEVGVYYKKPLPLEQKHTKCLSLFYMESPYPALQAHEKHWLLWYEAQYICKYERENVNLKTSLLSCTQTQQDYLYVVSICKLNTKEILEKVLSLSKALNAKRQRGEQLSRMEHLLLAQSSCILLINETDADNNNYMTLESKECCESNLQQLMQRPEILNINVNNELRLIRLALEAIEAYEYFFTQADTELISTDVCFIEWELIVDDLRYMALYLQYAGYNEHATRAWLLHYNMTGMLLDTYNQLRGFAFFCEYAEFFENNINTLSLQQEVEQQLLTLSQAITILPDLQRREQTTVLIACCQLAYYYARVRNFGYAQVLLGLVAQKREQLKERQGKYDIVIATMEAVKFRIMWKQLTIESCNDANTKTMQNSCLLSNIEVSLNRFREFTYISTSDAIPYMILLFNLTLQISECTANRLCDNLATFFSPNALKVSLQKGHALRVIQVLTVWMWVNLQAENVQKAQVKLQMIECVLGIKSWQKLAHVHKKEEITAIITTPVLKSLDYPMRSKHGGSVETLRRVMKKQDENINNMIIESADNVDLEHFLNWKPKHNSAHGEIYRWCSFVVGCLNARLHYINGNNYRELGEFYEKCEMWLEKEKKKNNVFMLIAFQNFELLLYQHYTNYLRATSKFENAQNCVERALKRCADMNRNVDVLYCINFVLQLHAIEKAIEHKNEEPKTRRVLKFTTGTPEAEAEPVGGNTVTEAVPKKSIETTAKKEEPVILTSTKKPPEKQQKFTIYTGEEDVKSTKTPKPVSNAATKTTKPISTAISKTTSASTTKTPKPTISATPKPTNTETTKPAKSKLASTAKTPKPTSTESKKTIRPHIKNSGSGSSVESCTSFTSSTSQLSFDDITVDLNCCQIIELYTSSELDEKDVQECKENTKTNNKLKKVKELSKKANASLVVIDLDDEDSSLVKHVNQEDKNEVEGKSKRVLRPTRALQQQQQHTQQQQLQSETPVSSSRATLRTRAARTRQINSDLEKIARPTNRLRQMK